MGVSHGSEPWAKYPSCCVRVDRSDLSLCHLYLVRSRSSFVQIALGCFLVTCAATEPVGGKTIWVCVMFTLLRKIRCVSCGVWGWGFGQTGGPAVIVCDQLDYEQQEG